jgi:DNA mismatch repair protein MutS
MSIINEYLELTKKYKKEYGEKTLVLMEVGSFFEVYALINPDGTYTGSNIEEFAKINDMVIAKKAHCTGDLQTVMAGMGTAHADKYIQKLQEHDYTIVIYKQAGTGKNITRILAEIISPGTFFPNESEKLSNNIMCVWLHKSKATKSLPIQVTVGMANIDIYTGKTSLFQFVMPYNHSPATYDELERYVSAYRPSECMVLSNIADNLVNEIIHFVGLENTKLHKINTVTASAATSATSTDFEKAAKNVEKQVYQVDIIKKYFPHLSEFHELFPTHSVAIQAFCFLLEFVYQHSPNLVKKLTEPVFENYSDRLILSNHTLHQLNIVDDARHTGRLRSVSSFLNNCVTTMGTRQFLYNLHYPITHEAKLQASYDITEHILATGLWQTIRIRLSTIADMEKLARKIVARKIMPKNLTSLVDDLTNIAGLYSQTRADTLIPHATDIDIACQTIQADIQRVFNLEVCRNLSDLNDIALIINKGISKKIDELCQDSMDGRDKLEAVCNYLSDQIQQCEKSTTKKTNYVRINETAKNNATLVGTSRRIALLKNALAVGKKTAVTLTYLSGYSKKTETFELDLTALEYTNSGSSKTDMIVTSKQIRGITSENVEAKENLIRETQLVFLTYIQDFAKFETDFQAIIKYTTEMDILQCKCYIAHKYNYCKPAIRTTAYGVSEATIPNKSRFAFTGIRHPLIEHLQTNELYVTNELTLGTKTNGILLYGTNAVGKTSFIKSVGIAIIMAQAGLYVPCETFAYQPYRNIFTRILGNDNIFKGLSTFAVEMTELRTIITMANQYSLVLGDELCSGTESDSALSIFTAGLEILHERESTFLFATHFHEINKYDEITNLTKMEMMHMAVHYNKETNVLVYDRKLRNGPGESMYGLEVCKSLNLPEAFLQRAHDIRMKYRPEKQNVLALAPTHFNARKLVGVCELCQKQKASEVHHLQHQKHANVDNDYIHSFHKNHVANLLNICEACHKKIHKTTVQHKVVKTTAGYMLEPI